MEQVLDDLEHHYCANNINNKTEFHSYIKSLKEPLSKFHQLINNYKGDTRMEYESKEFQIIYALKYFHAYWYQIYKALKIIQNETDCKDFESIESAEIKFRIALFGAGPAPEVIGITRFLEENRNPYKSIEIHFYDEVSEWSFARETFLFSNGKRNLLENNLKMKFFTHTINLTNPSDLDYFEDVSSSSRFDLICFQNCLNEFSESSRSTSYPINFLNVLESLNKDSYAIFSERNVSNARLGFEMVNDFAALKNYKEIIIDETSFDAKKDSPTPKILANGNFYKNPGSNAQGIAAMRWNEFKTFIIQKPIDSRISKENWEKTYSNGEICFRNKNYSPSIELNLYDIETNNFPFYEESIFHENYGWGILKDVVDNFLVIEFSHHKGRFGFPEPYDGLKISRQPNIESNEWFPNYGDKVNSSEYGEGVVRKIIKSKGEIEKLVIVFNDHGPVEIHISDKELRFIG